MADHITREEADQIAERAVERALQQGRGEFAKNGVNLWSKLIASAMVPVAVGFIGYGQLQATVDSLDETADQNRELIRQIQRSTGEHDHRISIVEGRAGSLRSELEDVSEKIEDMSNNSAQRHEELMQTLEETSDD